MDGPPRANGTGPCLGAPLGGDASARHWVALPPSARCPARPPASPEPSGVGRGRGVSPTLPGGHLPVVNPFVDSLFSSSPLSPPLLSAVLGMGAPKDSSSFTGNEPSVSLTPRAEGGGPGGRARRPGRGADGSSEVKSPTRSRLRLSPGAHPRAFVTADGKREVGFVALIGVRFVCSEGTAMPAHLRRALRPQPRGGRLPRLPRFVRLRSRGKGGAAVPRPRSLDLS